MTAYPGNRIVCVRPARLWSAFRRPASSAAGTARLRAKWLWRTLRAAELTGLDPAQALADAVGERDLAGSRDIPAVIDARLRARLGSLVPLPAGTWSAQVPPDRRP